MYLNERPLNKFFVFIWSNFYSVCEGINLSNISCFQIRLSSQSQYILPAWKCSSFGGWALFCVSPLIEIQLNTFNPNFKPFQVKKLVSPSKKFQVLKSTSIILVQRVQGYTCYKAILFAHSTLLSDCVLKYSTVLCNKQYLYLNVFGNDLMLCLFLLLLLMLLMYLKIPINLWFYFFPVPQCIMFNKTIRYSELFSLAFYRVILILHYIQKVICWRLSEMLLLLLSTLML